jgi:cysteine desulfuration protein SufE
MSDELRYEYILDAFRFLPDWESRYEFIEDLGKKLPPMDDNLKCDENRVQGCMSLVWIKAEKDSGSDVIILHGDSNASTIKGIVAILVAIFHGKTAREVLDTDTDEKFEELGLFDHLSPTRHVGVYAIVEQARRQVQAMLPRHASGSGSA